MLRYKQSKGKEIQEPSPFHQPYPQYDDLVSEEKKSGAQAHDFILERPTGVFYCVLFISIHIESWQAEMSQTLANTQQLSSQFFLNS